MIGVDDHVGAHLHSPGKLHARHGHRVAGVVRRNVVVQADLARPLGRGAKPSEIETATAIANRAKTDISAHARTSGIQDQRQVRRVARDHSGA